jgi:hypothetical protein
MKASQDRLGAPSGAVLDSGLPGSAARHENIVIENFGDLAPAGVSGICWVCWADCAAPRSMAGTDSGAHSGSRLG